jgi:1,4-alpha-glucan branching enzyme
VQFAYVDASAKSVNLAGNFNSWSTTADPLTGPDADGRWTITKTLAPGEYQYKFVVNSGTWKEDPANPGSVDDGMGGKNSALTVMADGSVKLAAPPRAGATSGGSTTGAGASGGMGGHAPKKMEGGYEFAFAAKGATSVALAGDFNGWSTSANPLSDSDGDGVWTLVMPLSAGDHQYKFVVNGSDWKPDPNNPQTVDDGFGGKNSVLHVE